MHVLCCATHVCPVSKSSAVGSRRCSLGTSQQLCQRRRVGWADPIVKIRSKSKLHCFSNNHRNWKMCAHSFARSCRKFHCRLSAESLRRSALCTLCLPASLVQMLPTTTFGVLWWLSLEASWQSFLSSGVNHGSMPYHLVVGVIPGVLPVVTSRKRTSLCSRGQDSTNVFLCMDLKLSWNWLPATIRLQWTFV